MPLMFPRSRGLRRVANWSGQPQGTTGDLVTASGTAHVLGTKVELLSAAENTVESSWVNIIVHDTFTAATNTSQLMNIYVGADTAEQLLIPNLLTGWAPSLTTAHGIRCYGFPLRIPRDTRVSADLQAAVVSDTCRVMIELLEEDDCQHWVGNRVETMGALTGTSRGTVVVEGTASEGTFTSMPAATTTTYEWGFLQPMLHGNSDTTAALSVMAVDVGIGGVALAEQFLFKVDAVEFTIPIGGGGRYCRVPAGSQLQLRAQGSVDQGGDGDYAIYGVF